MALSYKLITSPSESTRRLLIRRMMAGMPEEEKTVRSASWGAVLLVQGMVPEMFCAVDVGTKTSPVLAMEIIGSCPQHIVTMAFIGNVADVKQVLSALKGEGVIV